MNKASKALRRSSIRLKSFSCGHSELNLIVSDIKEIRSAATLFADAQETAWKDLSKWASRERNEAIRESFSYLVELSRLWAEVQHEFVEQINKFKYAFEMILEGEQSVDKLREHLTSSEARENKLKKDLQKAAKKNNSAEVREVEKRIMDTRASMKNTQIEITERSHENEAVKLVRLKEGLLKLTDSYLDVAYKSDIIFKGKKNIAASLPDLDQSQGIHTTRYRGSEFAKQTVGQVKETVKLYRQQVPQLHPGAPVPPQLDCPPPYSSFSQPHFYPPTYQNTIGFTAHHNGWPPRHITGAGRNCYDVLPPDDYEQDVAGAIGGVRM